MTYAQTVARTKTYTESEVDDVFRRISADFRMIAQSTRAMSTSETDDYIHDIKLFAINRVLKYVDLTLMHGSQEIRAVRFKMDSQSEYSQGDQPGEALWPAYPYPLGEIRIILKYRKSAQMEKIDEIKRKCRISWVSTNASCSHSNLRLSGERNYVSGRFGVKRKDWK